MLASTGGSAVVRRIITSIILLLAASGTGHLQSPQPTERETRTLNLSAYAELLRSDVRAQKIAIITEIMAFSDKEDAAFWPIYREYDLEMARLGDERVALIAEYARAFSTLDDATADRLAKKALDLQAKRQAALGQCFDRVKTALSPRTALRFLQVEHQLQLLIDLQISAALPIRS